MLDLRIQSLPPETLAAQRPSAEPVRPAVAPVATPSQGGGTGNTNSGGTETPREQFVSPFITIDPTSGLVITQYRNTATGELQQQYPSEKVVRQYQNLQPPAIAPSGGQAEAVAGPAGLAGRQSDTVAIGRTGSGAGSPAPGAAPPAPAQAPVPTGPTGGVDKGSA